MMFSGLPYLGTTDIIYYYSICIYDKISNVVVREEIFELSSRSK